MSAAPSEFAREAFRVDLERDLRGLSDTAAIVEVAQRRLGEFLKASRVGYGDVESEELRYFTTDRNWTDGTVASRAGKHDLAAFGSDTLTALRRGETLVINDRSSDPRISDQFQLAAFEALDIGAVVTATLVKDGTLRAALYVHQKHPREWTRDEVRIVEEVAERTWAAIERARAETALRESEARLRLAIDVGGMAVWEVDILNERVTGSPELNHLLGFSQDARLSLADIRAFYFPGELERLNQIGLEALTRGDRHFEAEFRYRHPNGAACWFLLRARIDIAANGTPLRAIGVLMDITDRKRSEDAARESEARLRQITDSLPALIGYVDADERYRFNNSAYLSWLGRSPETIYGLTLQEVAGAAAYKRIKPLVDRALSGERTSHEWWAPLDGGLRYIRSEYIPDIRDDKTVAGFHVLAFDLTDRQQAQDAVIQSERRLSTVLDSISDAFFALDTEFRLTVFNTAAERYFGRSRKEVLGQNVWEAFPAAAGSEFERRYRRIMAGGEAEVFEAPSAVRPGQFLEVSAAPQIGGGVTVSFADVTGRRIADQMLRERSMRLEILAHAMERAPGAASVDELAGIALEAARTLSQADGVAIVLRRGDECHYAAVKAAEPLWEGQSFPRERCVSGRAMRDRTTIVVEDVLEDSRIPLEIYSPSYVRSLVMVPLVHDGEATAAIGVYWGKARTPHAGEVNVLEALARTYGAVLRRLQAEDKLQRLNDTLEVQVAERTADRDRMWRLSTDVMLVATFDATILAVNPAWTSLLGWSADELIGKRFLHFVHPDDVASTTAEAGSLAEGRPTQRFENRYRAKNGTYRWLSWIAVPDNNFIHAVGRDVTEEKKHADALRLTQEALHQAQKMEAVGQLTGGVAHDFNNLLTIIRSSTDLLRRPDLPDERKRRYIDAIADTVDRASRLTGQLLAFARRQALKPEVFEVVQRVRSTSEMLRTVMGARIRIFTDFDCEQCHAKADTSQFETALVNLAVNARDAMDGQGTLTISVRVLGEMPPIRGHARAEGTFVAVTMKDTGSGIPVDKLPHIFEPFFTTKEVGKGTGLGLSQVYGFVKQSGGNIAVESEEGKGTEVTLFLPRVDEVPKVERRGPKVARPIEGGALRRVLVVEDNADVGMFSTQILQDLGYVTEWAASAAEALHILDDRSGSFDAVFSDVVMPGMSGVELGEEIRKRYPGLPVILTSGYSHVLAEKGRHGFELLHKPYAAEELSRLLRRVIGGRRPQSRG